MAVVLQQSLFIGRNEQLLQYRVFLGQTSPWLLLVTGMPGCGKSTFLRHIQQKSTPTEVVVLLDFADRSLQVDPLKLLSDVSHSIAPFCADEMAELFRQRAQEERTRLTQHYSQQVEEIARQFQEQTPESESEVECLLMADNRESSEIASLHAVQDALLNQLDTLPSHKHLILLFDTCEWLDEPAGRRVQFWLLEQLLPAIHTRCSCHAVLASRAPLSLPPLLTQPETSEPTKASPVEIIKLAELDESAAKEYLLSINMPEEICKHMYRITRGHPLCFAIFCLLWQEELLEGGTIVAASEKELEHLEDEYNERMLVDFIQTRLDDRLPTPYREWTHYGILLRRFNREVLQAVFPELLCSEENFQRFVSYPYVKLVAGETEWYCVHEMLRETLFEVIHRQEKEAWQRYHQRAWRYYKGQPEQFYHAVAMHEIKGLTDWDRAMRTNLGLSLSSVWLFRSPYDRTLLVDVLEDQALQHSLSTGGKKLYKDSREDFELQRMRQEESGKPTSLSLPGSSKDKVKKEKEVRDQFKIRSQQRRISLFSLIALIIGIILPVGFIAYIIGSVVYPPARQVSPSNQVTTLADSGPGSLRKLIATANTNATITFAPQLHGTIFLNQDLNFAQNITVLGAGLIALSNGHRQDVHINILKNATVIWNKLAFTDSLVLKRSFIYNEGNLTLNECVVKNNISYDSGGGITNQSGTITIIDSTISQNFASSNGGGIYMNDGTVTITGSAILSNTAFENGGGIFGLHGAVNLSNDIHATLISSNQTLHNQASRGGGIAVLDSQLTITGSTIQGNWTPGIGGGISVLGSQASISDSRIAGNLAENGARELSVEIDPESQKDGQVVLADLALPPYTGNPTSYIGFGQDKVPDIIRGTIAPGSSRPQIKSISVSDNNIVGTPAPVQVPPEESSDYHGNIDIAKYCKQLGDPEFDDTKPFALECISSSGIPKVVNALQICQQQHPNDHITTARLADYFDPTSWQCYANARPLGPIASESIVDSFCKYAGNLGIFPHERNTAYDWKCLHQGGTLGHYKISMQNFPVGLSVTDMCRYAYKTQIGQKSLAMDSLTDYNNPSGWACWELPDPVLG